MTFLAIAAAFLVLLLWLLLRRRPAAKPDGQVILNQWSDAPNSTLAPALFVTSQVAEQSGMVDDLGARDGSDGGLDGDGGDGGDGGGGGD